MESLYINRPPRVQPVLPFKEIEIPAPPEIKGDYFRQLLQVFTPMITIIGYLLVSTSGQGRNLLLLVPMALSVLVSSGVSLYSFIQEQREAREKRQNYQRLLSSFRREILEYQDKQRSFFYYNHPDKDTVLLIAQRDTDSDNGNRLWERRTDDKDFCHVRLGIGTRASTVNYALSKVEGDSNDLLLEAQKLIETSRIVSDVPICIALRAKTKEEEEETETKNPENLVSVGSHALGIVPKKSEYRPEVSEFLRAILVDLTCFHSPADLQLHIIAAPQTDKFENGKTGRWVWTRMLPHCDNENTVQQGDYRCMNDIVFEAGVEQQQKVISPQLFWNNLKVTLENRRKQLVENARRREISLPHILLVVDMLEPSAELIPDKIESNPVITTILRDGPRLGASVIFIANNIESVPSGCKALIEFDIIDEQKVFYYNEIGFNSPRYTGLADLVDHDTAQQLFVKAIENLKVRRTEGGLRKAIDYLSMMRLVRGRKIVSMRDDLGIWEQWQRSMESRYANWLRLPIGTMEGDEIKWLEFSADKDGVHGLVAGTTGSGKSEMLQTLICSLAVHYDPRVLNFVLVDYKGGAAFAPFENLPHVVDIVTNLQGRAVERMFDAIKSELDRRSAMLKDYGVREIIEYRQNGYHRTDLPAKDKSKPHQPFPHLLIIVDEFAEMIAANADFKGKFESIARLGRALGVSLILATQRPTGYVTDQMRANMKFRICLRVESSEDSREILGRNDAAFLASDIPGRAYVQTGNDNPDMVQVAWSGAAHNENSDEGAMIADVIWEDEQKESFRDLTRRDITTAQRLETNSVTGAVDKIPENMVDWIVEISRQIAIQNGIEEQTKPWPDPLPNPMPDPISERRNPLTLNLPIDTSYIDDVSGTKARALNEHVALWMNLETDSRLLKHTWQGVDWNQADNILNAPIGIIDNPVERKQIVLNINLQNGPIAVFGANGWGKTSFLRSLILALTAKHSPAELHIYAIDFDSQGLKVLEPMPHVEVISSTDANIEALLERLLRMMDTIIDERKNLVARHGGMIEYNKAVFSTWGNIPEETKIQSKEDNASLEDDNTKFLNDGSDNTETISESQRLEHFDIPDAAWLLDYEERLEKIRPQVLIVIDNFAEIKENYDDSVMMTFARLIRNGRNYGIYFAVSANLLADLGKVGNLFTQRLSFKQTDPGEYNTIFARRSPNFDDISGRGLTTYNRNPLVMQIALPVQSSKMNTASADLEETINFEELAQKMSAVWPYSEYNPEPIEILPENISLNALLTTAQLGLGDAEKIEIVESSSFREKPEFGIPVGLNDVNRMAHVLDLKRMGPSMLVMGPPQSGRTNTLRTIVMSIAQLYTPEEVGLVLIDTRRSLYEYGRSTLNHSLADLPHVLDVASTQDQVSEIIERLRCEYDENHIRELEKKNYHFGPILRVPSGSRRSIVVLIDNYDSFAELIERKDIEALAKLVLEYSSQNLFFILAGSASIARIDSLAKRVREPGYGLALDTKTTEALDGRVPFSSSKGVLPPGRAYVIKATRTNLIHIAKVFDDFAESTLDAWIKDIQKAYPVRKAHWREVLDGSGGNDKKTKSDTVGTEPQRVGRRYTPKK